MTTAVLNEVERILGDVYPVPSEASLDGEFSPAPDLDRLIPDLRTRHPGLAAWNCRLTLLWRDRGGKTKGRPTLGRCTKPTGLLRHFADTDIVIWLAADHLRERGATRREVEAVLFHELSHVSEDEEGAVFLVGHEAEVFFSELEHYGKEVRHLRAFVRAVQQLRLPE